MLMNIKNIGNYFSLNSLFILSKVSFKVFSCGNLNLGYLPPTADKNVTGTAVPPVAARRTSRVVSLASTARAARTITKSVTITFM